MATAMATATATVPFSSCGEDDVVQMPSEVEGETGLT